MKSVNTSILTLSGILLLTLAGCAKYESRPIKTLVTPGQVSDQSVSIAYKVFDEAACYVYLGRNLIKKGFQPIQITITNNTNHHFTLSPDSFSCECIDPKIVTEQMHTSTAGRAAGYGAAAWSLTPIFAIPAIVDGVRSSKSNKKMDLDYAKKSIADEVIAPYSTLNGVIFIPTTDSTRHITVTLADAANRRSYTLSNAQPIVKI